MVKEQTINVAIIEAMADLCEKRCKEGETCTESCPEHIHLFEMLWKYPITEVELDEERDLFVSEIEEEKTESQMAMSEFVQRWTEAGKPIDKDWYELFMKHRCLNLDSPDACNTGYCPMGEEDCSNFVEIFS